MSAAPHLEAVERRSEQGPVEVLFVGAALAGATRVFKRKQESVRAEHASSPSEAVDIINARAAGKPFDCVLIDMRDQNGSNPLNLVAIAALQPAPRIIVLAQPEDTGRFLSLTGVDTVLEAPVDPRAIINAIVNSVPKDEPEPAPVAEPEPEVSEEVPSVTPGFESSISKASEAVLEADQQVWQRFVPLANFLYKKLAIVVLTALFLTFLAYGALIVFFMSSSSWSLPFELSRGHLLVEKTERDLSSLRLRRNQLRQDLVAAQSEALQAERDRRDGILQITLTRRTIEEEIILRTTQKLEIEEHIKRLKQVIRDFNEVNGQGGFARNLEGAFAKRLITKNRLNSGTLAVLETLHRMATVQNEISQKQLELQKVDRILEFLRSLLAELDNPEVQVITSAGADLSYLARDAIEAKNRIAAAEQAKASADERLARLQNSYDVIDANVTSLEKTPAARALIAPVTVLFVPYTNAAEVAEGEPLYDCALSLFFCRKVGTVGPAVEGETTSVHPLFGKPMRGTFREAVFGDPSAVTAEIVHAGRPPLFF